jgi:hypothetical protein
MDRIDPIGHGRELRTEWLHAVMKRRSRNAIAEHTLGEYAESRGNCLGASYPFSLPLDRHKARALKDAKKALTDTGQTN